jgi:hypothetical protein
MGFIELGLISSTAKLSLNYHENEKLQFGHLESLIYPGGRRISREDNQGDQNETQ